MQMLDNSTGRSSQRQPSILSQPAITERDHTNPALVFRRAVGQRLATAIGGVIAALACAVALPAHAQAATVAWSTQKPPGACGPARSISTGSGYANIRDCLKIARSASGTYYYNGVLEVDYHRAAGYVGDVLGGKSMIARVGDKYALGVNDCPRQRWINDQTRWCYSPTKTGQRIYGKGVLLNNAGRWYPPVWSPVKLRYVALGDSFSSGEGAFDYLPAATGRPARCHRSRNAYSQILAPRLRGGVRHDPRSDFWACSGDEVPQLTKRQLGALGPDVGLVTVGIGGNDAGWADTIKACMLDASTYPRPGTGKGCKRIIAERFKRRLPILRTRLRAAYAKIRRRVPQATVIVVGYPAIFEDSLRSIGCASAGPLTRGARADLREAAEQLNAEIRATARSFRFRFVDPRRAFNDHRICGPAEDWIHGLTLGRKGKPLLSPITFHPNREGQRGYAEVIAAANRDIFT